MNDGINDEFMTAEKIKELKVTKDMSAITCKQVLLWAKQIEAQESQTAMLMI